MKRGTCLLCFAVNVKTYNIKDTHLQYVYEELSDFMFQVHTHLHTLCYLCCAKLQQFYQLLKQTRNIQVDYLPLVQLSTVKISNTLQGHCVIIKQEPDVKEESSDFLKVELDIQETQENCKVKEAEEERTECETTPADKKLHSCDICNMKFSQKSNLNTHKRRHSGVKPYICDICNKTFSERRYLNIHKPTHIGAKPYSCEICNKKFSQKSHLNTHKLTHTGVKPYSCDICEKKFSERHYLNTHKLIHSVVKPYSCDICTKKFCHTGHLNRHKLTHTGVKPYSCDICEKKFNQKGHLSKHKLTHIKTIQHIKTTIMCPNIQ